MAKNIEKLAKIGESTLRLKLEDNLERIKRGLQHLVDYPKINYPLHLAVNIYNSQNKLFKKRYGVEFPDLQEEYEKMLPEIKKYVEVKD